MRAGLTEPGAEAGLRRLAGERMFVSVERFHELENLRRSLAMLPPGSAGLNREDAMRVIAECQALELRLQRLKDELQRLVWETG